VAPGRRGWIFAFAAGRMKRAEETVAANCRASVEAKGSRTKQVDDKGPIKETKWGEREYHQYVQRQAFIPREAQRRIELTQGEDERRWKRLQRVDDASVATRPDKKG